MARHPCVNHKDRPAATMCSRCHKPACRECVVTMPHGLFCSIECSAQFQDFKRRQKEAAKFRPSATMAFLMIAGVLALLLIGYHVGVSALPQEAPLVQKLKKFDVIGIILEGARRVPPRQGS